jgi:hypothetical protein
MLARHLDYSLSDDEVTRTFWRAFAMNNQSRVGPVYLSLALLISATAIAQAPTAGRPLVTRPDANASAPFYDPAQLPSFNGKVQQFTLSPRGEIDGFVLTDGTEVKTPPHLSSSIAYAIRLGDAVTIHGLRAAAIPLLQATSITDHASGRTIIDTGPGPGPEAAMVEVHGSIRMSLHGARGEINGVLLTDGTVLRLPPDAAINMDTVLQPGRSVVAQGDEVLNPIGKVLEVRAIGASRAELMPVDPPSPPGPRDRNRPPPPRPDAPPPPPPGAG